MKHLLRFAFLFSTTALAQPPAGYYDAALGLNGPALQSALHNIIKDHVDVGYTPGLWNAYYTTDVKPGTSKLWTIYSDKPGAAPPYEFTLGTNQCSGSTPTSEGGCYNREHAWPRTYFGGSVPPMNSDLWIVYPVDAYVNGKRGSLPYGEVVSPTQTFLNGTRIGPNAAPGAPSGSAFEPIDSFKGDVARSYFYVATRYLGEDGGWDNWDMAAGAALKPWAVQMLLEWHYADPVSTKEHLRNDAIFALQEARNPFIDYPQFADCIWAGEDCAALDIRRPTKRTTFYAAPSPASDILRVFFGSQPNADASLLDALGRTQLRTTIHSGEDINVSALPRGMYMLYVRTAVEVAVLRVALE